MSRVLLRLIGPAIVIAIWWLTTTLGWIDRLFLASPEDTIRSAVDLLTTSAGLSDVYHTLRRVAGGFALGCLFGIPAGLFLGGLPKVYQAVEIVVEYCRSLPATALFPLFLVFFGIGDAAKLAVACFISTWIILVNTATGVANANRTRLAWFQTLQPSWWNIFRHVLIYEAAPHLASGLRTCLGLSFVVVIAVEMFIGSKYGLGKRIYDAQLGAGSNVPEMYAAIFVAGLLGYILNLGFLAMQKRLLHWVGK